MMDKRKFMKTVLGTVGVLTGAVSVNTANSTTIKEKSVGRGLTKTFNHLEEYPLVFTNAKHGIGDMVNTDHLHQYTITPPHIKGAIVSVLGLNHTGKSYYLAKVAKQRLKDNHRVMHIRNEELTDFELTVHNYQNEYNVISVTHLRACVEKNNPEVLLIDDIDSLYHSHFHGIRERHYKEKINPFVALIKEFSDKGIEIYFTGRLTKVVSMPNDEIKYSEAIPSRVCKKVISGIDLIVDIDVVVIEAPFVIASRWKNRLDLI